MNTIERLLRSKAPITCTAAADEGMVETPFSRKNIKADLVVFIIDSSMLAKYNNAGVKRNARTS